MDGTHILDHDAERYYLGMVTTDEELATLEEHLLGCHDCLDLVLGTENYVDTIRLGLLNTSERARSTCGRLAGRRHWRRPPGYG
jgi:hypothetical protein